MPDFELQRRQEEVAEVIQYSQHELIVPDADLRKAEQIVTELGLYYRKRQSRARESLENGAWVPGEYTLALFHDAECSRLISQEMTGRILQAMLTAKVTARLAELEKTHKEASESELGTAA